MSPAVIGAALRHPAAGPLIVLFATTTFAFAMMESTFALVGEHRWSMGTLDVGGVDGDVTEALQKAHRFVPVRSSPAAGPAPSRYTATASKPFPPVAVAEKPVSALANKAFAALRTHSGLTWTSSWGTVICPKRFELDSDRTNTWRPEGPPNWEVV